MKLVVVTISLLLLIVGLAVTVVVDAARRPVAINHQHHYYAPEKVHEHMPDHTDPKNKPKLACSSCKVLTDEVWTRLHDLAKKNNNRPRMHQQVDVIERMCEEVKHEYGLVMRNNRPTLEFSRDEAISRIKGAWINNYLEGRCGKILASHEEQILEKYKQVRNLAEFQSVICQKLDKSCHGEELYSPNADL